MSVREMKDLRTQADLTQRELADQLGLGLTAYQDLETEFSRFKPRHQIMLERVSLKLAVERRDINLALPAVRRDALDLAELIRG